MKQISDKEAMSLASHKIAELRGKVAALTAVVEKFTSTMGMQSAKANLAIALLNELYLWNDGPEEVSCDQMCAKINYICGRWRNG